MARWLVEGASRETGRDVRVVIEATVPAAAEARAAASGILVSTVRVADAAVSEAPPLAGGVPPVVRAAKRCGDVAWAACKGGRRWLLAQPRWVLAVLAGLAVMGFIGMFPPFQRVLTAGGTNYVGHSFLLSAPRPETEMVVTYDAWGRRDYHTVQKSSVTLATGRLFLEWAVVAFLAGGVAFALHRDDRLRRACPRCGAAVGRGAFCARCGASIPAPRAPHASRIVASPSPASAGGDLARTREE